MTKLQNLLKGLIKENPVLVLVLGTCPTLAISTSVTAAFGMGIAATVVLILSNMAISALRKIIPDTVRIPCYITVIAGFVTIVEMYANKHGVVDSAIDGLGMGLGFTLALCAMATIREILGAGTFCGMPIPWFSENPIGILTMAPGGFFVFGCMIALVNKITKGKAITKKEFGCAACPGCGKAGACSGKEEAAK